MFHSITGCDTVSAFSGIDKKGAWKVWLAFPSINSAFDQLLTDKSPDEESLMLTVQRFVVLLYDITSHINRVNDCRRVLFKKNRSIENIPPTENALCQHVKRATLQAVMWIIVLKKTTSLLHRTLGGGKSVVKVICHCGQPFLMWQEVVKNLSHVSAKNDALRANVLKTDYSVKCFRKNLIT